MELLSGATFKCRPMSLITSIRLGWKGLPGTSTLAYYENLFIMVVKRFIGLDSRSNILAQTRSKHLEYILFWVFLLTCAPPLITEVTSLLHEAVERFQAQVL